MAVEEPVWQVYSETLVGFVPVLGSAVALYEAIGGENMFGRRIPVWQRVVLGVAALVPVAAGLFRAGGAAVTAARLARTYRLNEPEALLLLRSLTRLRPGAAGAAQLEQAVSDIRAGRQFDAARRTQLRRLFDDMGLGAGGASRSRFAATKPLPCPR